MLYYACKECRVNYINTFPSKLSSLQSLMTPSLEKYEKIILNEIMTEIFMRQT